MSEGLRKAAQAVLDALGNPDMLWVSRPLRDALREALATPAEPIELVGLRLALEVIEAKQWLRAEVAIQDEIARLKDGNR